MFSEKILNLKDGIEIAFRYLKKKTFSFLQISWQDTASVFKTVIKNSHIRETPTLSTDVDSRTNTILERLRHLPIRTEKLTLSTRKCGLGPR